MLNHQPQKTTTLHAANLESNIVGVTKIEQILLLQVGVALILQDWHRVFF